MGWGGRGNPRWWRVAGGGKVAFVRVCVREVVRGRREGEGGGGEGGGGGRGREVVVRGQGREGDIGDPVCTSALGERRTGFMTAKIRRGRICSSCFRLAPLHRLLIAHTTSLHSAGWMGSASRRRGGNSPASSTAWTRKAHQHNTVDMHNEGLR